MSDQLISHPEKLLIVHLSEVAKIATQTIDNKCLKLAINYHDEPLDISKLIKDLVYFAAAFHDIGKASGFFQFYIRNLNEKHDNRKNHALISAVFVYFVVEKYLKSQNIGLELSELLSVFTFSAVKRHHGRLANLRDEILIDEQEQNLLSEIILAIDTKKVQEIIDSLLENFNLNIDWLDFVDFIQNKKYNDVFDDFSFDVLDESYNDVDSETRITLYYAHQLIYSALLFADKNDVILDKEISGIEQVDVLQKIADYRAVKNFNNPKSEIDKLKNEAFFTSLEELENVFDKEQHIYSVTLPTGLGKTITAYNLADKMRKLAGFESSKIIINIPFTSIIDQNFEVYSEILQSKNTDTLLKHHHLAEPSYKKDENISDYYQSKFLIETWQSDTIVTTFVQLLETLLSCDKAKLMKFSHLANSVILLDEIQTIPYKLWETIRETFKILGKKLNIYFILISATQPLIFTPGKDIVELIPNHRKYFQFFNRTKLLIKGKISFEDFKKTLNQYISKNSKKDILVIVNTKKAAQKIFEFVRENIDKKGKEIYFLSTLITPFERKEIIKRILQKSHNQKIIVSTQLVEAGVDISVNTVFRELSPIDSIIQAAGRANRYFTNSEISEVFIYEIEEYRKASNFVYGNDLLIKTENVLKGFHEVEEQDYIKLIEKYFIEVRKQSDNTSQPYLNAIKNLDFGEVDFELIEKKKTESVYVQLNTKAKEIWGKYVQIIKNEELKPWERNEEFSHIKTEFYDFVINVPVKWDRANIVFDSEKKYNFYVSELENPSKNYSYSKDDYSQNTGYSEYEEAIQFL